VTVTANGKKCTVLESAPPGLFWGAPAVAQELETRTNQFAWTQDITRSRWLAVRAGWLLSGAAVLVVLAAILLTVTFWVLKRRDA
jgi:hypothetical protein